MSVSGDTIKEDGHTILLMELTRNERTYSDYPTLHKCLESMIEMYHESCESNEEQDLKSFFKWIDDFYSIRLLSFEREISRYKVKVGSDLKNLFEENEENKGTYRPTQNGTDGNFPNSSNNSCSLNTGADYRELDMEQSDDDENWDD